MTKHYQELTANKVGKVRKDRLNGRDYLVAPMAMITEGVHVGSNGALFYPAEELSKVPAVWNTKPVVVYHPKDKGVSVSACTPAMLEKHSVGMILNTEWDAETAKLRAEAWFEEKRLKSVDIRVYNALIKNEVMEVSTGLFTDNEEETGEWNGEEYVAVARNYRPDHLAILPDQIGACSVADGAGLLQVNEARQKVYKTIQEFEANELSHDMIRRRLYGKLSEAYGDAWIEDVFSDYVVYSLGGKFYKLGYSVSGENVTLDDSPVKVERVVDFQPATNLGTPPADNEDSSTMSKKVHVDALIANKNTDWQEADRKTLESMEEKTLERLVKNSKEDAPAEPPKTETKPDEKTGETKNTEPPKTEEKPTEGQQQNNQRRKLTMEDLPPEAQEVVANARAIVENQKKSLVQKVLSNKKNKLTEAQLNAMSSDVLQGLVASLVDDDDAHVVAGGFDVSDFDFSGAGGFGTNAAEDDDEPLVPPSSFSKATK